MCEWGNTRDIEVIIPSHLSSKGIIEKKIKPIDSCISDIVRALVESDIITISSCCGHEKTPSQISLLDGREIFIFKNKREMQIIFSEAFQSIEKNKMEKANGL